MNVTATGHIRTWMQPQMNAREPGRNGLWTVQKTESYSTFISPPMDVIATEHYSTWILPPMDVTATEHCSTWISPPMNEFIKLCDQLSISYLKTEVL